MNYSLAEQETEDTWIDGSSVYEITVNASGVLAISESHTILKVSESYAAGGIPFPGEENPNVAKINAVGWVWSPGAFAVKYMKVRYIKSVLT